MGILQKVVRRTRLVVSAGCAADSGVVFALPAAPLTVALYLLKLTQTANSFSTVKLASAAIAAFHSFVFFFFFWEKKPYMPAKFANRSNIGGQLEESLGDSGIHSTTHNGGSCFAMASDVCV